MATAHTTAEKNLWTHVGPNYRVMLDSEMFRIFPKGRDGQSIPVTISRFYINVQHATSKELVTFKRHLHQKRWKWNDSRSKGVVSEQHVLGELARMLYGGDRAKAEGLVLACLMGQSIPQ